MCRGAWRASLRRTTVVQVQGRYDQGDMRERLPKISDLPPHVRCRDNSRCPRPLTGHLATLPLHDAAKRRCATLAETPNERLLLTPRLATPVLLNVRLSFRRRLAL
jgi:hypothetical protein